MKVAASPWLLHISDFSILVYWKCCIWSRPPQTSHKQHIFEKFTHYKFANPYDWLVALDVSCSWGNLHTARNNTRAKKLDFFWLLTCKETWFMSRCCLRTEIFRLQVKWDRTGYGTDQSPFSPTALNEHQCRLFDFHLTNFPQECNTTDTVSVATERSSTLNFHEHTRNKDRNR